MNNSMSQRILTLALLCTSLACYSATLSTPNLVLGRPTASTMTVNVLSEANVLAYIEYGTQSTVYASQTGVTNLPANQPVEIDLTGLSADTRYYYRLNYKLAGD